MNIRITLSLLLFFTTWSAGLLGQSCTTPANPNVTLNPTNVCQGQTCAITATGAGGATFKWYDNNPPVNPPIHTGATYTTPALNAQETYWVSQSTSTPFTLTDGFEGGFNNAIWDPGNAGLQGGGPVLNGCGYTGTWIRMFFDDGNPRRMTTQGMNVLGGATISFNLSIGLAAGTCNYNFPEEAEPVVLQYSTDNGATYVDIQSFVPSAGLSFAYSAAIPAAAQTASTKFRITQDAYNVGICGPEGCDLWFLDNFQISGNSVCESALQQVDVPVTPSPAPPSANGATICAGQSVTLTASGIGQGNSVAWYGTPSGGNPIFTQATITANNINTTTTIYVAQIAPAGSCPSPRTAVTVTVNPLPSAPATADTSICNGVGVIVNASGAPGALIEWFDAPAAGNLIGSGGTLPVAPNVTTNYYVQQTLNGCTSSRSTLNVNVRTAPTTPQAAPATVCEGATANLSTTPDAGALVLWFDAPNGGTAIATGPNFTTPALLANATYYLEQTIVGCTSPRSQVVVTVNPTPPPPNGTGATICAGANAQLTATGNAGATINWYDAPTGGTLLHTGNTYNVNGAMDTTLYFISQTLSGCVGPRSPVTLAVNPVPPLPNATDETICFGENAILTAFGAPGANLEWFEQPALGLPIANGTTLNVQNPLTSDTFYVQQSSAGCASAREMVILTVNPTPAAPTVATQAICAGTTATLTAVGTGTISWYADATLTILVNTGTTYTTPILFSNTLYWLTSTSGSGCVSAVGVATVTVNPVPVAPSVDPTVICAETSATLDADATGSVSWFTNANLTNLAFAGNPFVTPILQNNTSYWVTQTSQAGCRSLPFQVNVTVNPIPAAPTAIDLTRCAGETASFTALGELGAIFEWFTTAVGGQPFANGGTYTVNNPLNSDTFYVQQTLNGCTSERQQVVLTVNGVPTAPVVPAESICEGTAATFGTQAPGAVNWYADATLSVLLQSGNNFTTPILYSNTLYWVTQTSASGCTSLATVASVTVNPVPATPLVDQTVLCNGETATLTAAANGTVSWYSDAALDSLRFTGNPFTTPALVNNTTYWVTQTTAAGCESLPFVANITVHPVPAAPTCSDITICNGETANFIALGDFGATYDWFNTNVGGQAFATGNTLVVPNATASDTFFVQQTLNGCPGIREQVILTVNPRPTSPPVVSQSICEATTANLTATGTGTIRWYGDATLAVVLQTGNNFTTPVLYSNTLYWITETSASGCVSPATVASVTVNPIPSSPLVAPATICAGETTTLNATATGTVSWYGDAALDSLKLVGNPYTTPVLFNSTYYWVTQTSAAGCESPAYLVGVTVNPIPATPQLSGDTQICAGESTTFTAFSGVGMFYNWSGPGGFTANTPSITIDDATAQDAGAYTVRATLNSCTSLPSSLTLVVNALPEITDTIRQNQVAYCESETAILSAEAGPHIIFEWTLTDGTLIEGDSVVMDSVTEADNQGFYTLVVTDTLTGCSSLPYSTLVVVHPVPQVLNATSNSPICAYETLELHVTTYPGATYHWTGPGGDLFTANPTLPYAQPFHTGTYRVQVTTEHNCLIGVEGVVEATVNALPALEAGTDITINQGESAQFSALGIGSFDWTPVIWLNNPNYSNPMAVAPEPGQYQYHVSLTDAEGCVSVDSLLLTVLPEVALEISEAFTPNGDGKNDTWFIKYIENISDYNIKVYDRGGAVVFETSSYANEWGGDWKGKPLPAGAYWYVITTQQRIYKGGVTILK